MNYNAKDEFIFRIQYSRFSWYALTQSKYTQPSYDFGNNTIYYIPVNLTMSWQPTTYYDTLRTGMTKESVLFEATVAY